MNIQTAITLITEDIKIAEKNISILEMFGEVIWQDDLKHLEVLKLCLNLLENTIKGGNLL